MQGIEQRRYKVVNKFCDLAFLNIADNTAIQQDEAIAASLVAQTILVLMSNQDEWQGTPTESKKELDEIAKDLFNIELVGKLEGWPKYVTRLSRELTRLAPILKAEGIEFSRPKKGNREVFFYDESLHLPRITLVGLLWTLKHWRETLASMLASP